MEKEPLIKESHYLDPDGGRRKYVNRYDERGNLIEQVMYNIIDGKDEPAWNILQTFDEEGLCIRQEEYLFEDVDWRLGRITETHWEWPICTEILSERNGYGEMAPTTKKVHTYKTKDVCVSTVEYAMLDGEWTSINRLTCELDAEDRGVLDLEEQWIGMSEDDPNLWMPIGKTEYTYGDNPTVTEYELNSEGSDSDELRPSSLQVEKREDNKSIYSFHRFENGEWILEHIGVSFFAEDDKRHEKPLEYIVTDAETNAPLFKTVYLYHEGVYAGEIHYEYEDGEWIEKYWNKYYF